MGNSEKTSGLLIEIGFEEIPAGYLEPAAASIKKIFSGYLKDSFLLSDLRGRTEELLNDGGSFYTPRRITLFFNSLPESITASQIFQGPPSKLAVKNEGIDFEHPAVKGFMQKNKLAAADIFISEDGKYVSGKKREELNIDSLVWISLEQTLFNGLLFPKNMRWMESLSLKSARPIRWVFAMYGNRMLHKAAIEHYPCAGLRAISADMHKNKDMESFGNRFFGFSEDSKNAYSSAPKIMIESASVQDYLKCLEKTGVIADPPERKRRIKEQIKKIYQDRKIVFHDEYIDEGLLDTVSNLVEWPAAFAGDFEEEFLKLPVPVIVTVMKKHQKYFPLYKRKGELLQNFIGVANRPLDDPVVRDNVLRGNSRVLRARLKDAVFFLEEDHKKPFESRVEILKQVTYHKALKTYFEKTLRIQGVVECLSEALGSAVSPQQKKAAARAAFLSKADLTTEMVKEFTELQGEIGYEYSLEPEGSDIALAIRDQYRPAGADGALPETMAGSIVSLADKIDTVAAFFSAGFKPTGSQDPYALRRAGVGIVKIVLGNPQFHFSLSGVVKHVLSLLERQGITLKVPAPQTEQAVLEFLKERLEYILGTEHNSKTLQTALSLGVDDINAVKKRLESLSKAAHGDALTLERAAKVCERTKNIIKNVDAQTLSGGVQASLFTDSLEEKLWGMYISLPMSEKEICGCAFSETEFCQTLKDAAALYDVMHEYFDKVLVNDPDPSVRENRLRVMNAVYSAIFCVTGDLSLLL